MTTTPVTIPNLPTASTIDLIADIIRNDLAHRHDLSQETARTIARDVLAVLVGDDDNPGPLDRYQVAAEIVPGTGKPLVMWYCPNAHDRSRDGHVGIIARNMDGDQTGLTLGEIVGATLAHEEEDH